MMAVRVGLTNQNTLMIHLPNLSWALALRIEYLTFFLGLPLFSLFIKSLYPKDIHRWFIRLTFGLGFGFSLYMVFTDTLSLSYTPKYYQIIILLEMIYLLLVLRRIVAKRREGATHIMVASLVLTVAVIVETLSLRSILPYGQITSFSFLGYIFVLATRQFNK